MNIYYFLYYKIWFVIPGDLDMMKKPKKVQIIQSQIQHDSHSPWYIIMIKFNKFQYIR